MKRKIGRLSKNALWLNVIHRQLKMTINRDHSRALEIKAQAEHLPTVSVNRLGGMETYNCITGRICICIFT